MILGVVRCSLRGMNPLTSYPIGQRRRGDHESRPGTACSRRQVTQSSIGDGGAPVNPSYEHKGPTGIATTEKVLNVERPENGLHLDGGTGYEVDKPGGVKHGKQYSVATDTELRDERAAFPVGSHVAADGRYDR